jgi:CHAT domain-containing protein/tetratricopeptide (TPR) repeat protein
MSRRVARAVALIVPCLGALASGSISTYTGYTGQTAVPSARLEPGRSIEQPLGGDAEHRYTLNLKQGEFAAVSVQQRGLDVVLQVLAPDGTILSECARETRDGQYEHAEVVAVASGIHTLTVKAGYPRMTPGAYDIRLVETRDATNDDRVRQELRTLRAAYGQIADIHAARPLVERALALAERTLGAEPLEVAAVRRDLAIILRRSREHASAVTHFEQVAATFETVLGADHPATAEAWVSLAATYPYVGQRPKAEALAQRALAASEQALGPEHPQVALCLITLANLRQDAQDLDRAEEFLRRTLAIVEKTEGPNGQLSVVLNNLGQLLIERQKFEQADPLLRRSLEISERNGEEGVGLAITLQNLGITARQRRDYAKSEEYYLRALALRRQTLGPDHPDIALNLNNLATLYRATGNLPRSLETHLQALSILEKNTGKYSIVTALGNIARTYAAMDDLPHAIEFQRRVDTAIETQLALQLAVGSERQKLAYVNSLADRIERTISLDVGARFSEPQATELAALVVLQRKGRVLDAMTDTFASVRRRLGSAEEQQVLDDLAKATRELARVALSDPQGMSSSERLAAIQRLERQRESLESALSERSAEFRAQAAPVTLEAVQAALPDDAALIEFAVYRSFDPKAESNTTAYGAARYVAYIVTRRGTRGVDLGLASAVDEAVGAFRQALGDPRRADVSKLARQVDAAVMQPVRDRAGSPRRLLISPDGALNLLPFEALRDEQGRYAIERFHISYVSSGRDLLRLQAPRHSRSAAVVVADPLFGDPAAPAVPVPPAARTARTARAGSGATARAQDGRRSLTSIDDLANAWFAPLRGTALEAERIKTLFPEAIILSRARATSLEISRLKAPRVLHIATHGFFIHDTDRRIPNPLLRSGLALTGANLKSAQDGNAAREGILTALEASNLDLWGTKLVTLSACDTGIGEIRNGEGVYGLRRAFFLAGAETLVMSLWPVSDYITRELMADYYAALKKGLGRGDALRHAKLKMLELSGGRQHPFYWASFIQAGEWASLDGRR